tara:strand:- start:14776 stop:15087 length:312 start_codon:yes stop_codon:yes gene_type:complete
MYNFSELNGQVVTVKTVSGMELIGTLQGTESDDFTICLRDPRLVVISNNEIAVVPYTFTSKSEIIFITKDQYISVSKSLDNSSSDYLSILQETSEDFTVASNE